MFRNELFTSIGPDHYVFYVMLPSNRERLTQDGVQIVCIDPKQGAQ